MVRISALCPGGMLSCGRPREGMGQSHVEACRQREEWGHNPDFLEDIINGRPWYVQFVIVRRLLCSIKISSILID